MHVVESPDLPITAGGYHVHVYAVIRIKMAVTAPDHRSAMETADYLLFGHGVPVALVPRSPHIAEVEHADEVIGYLVDEVGDDDHECTRAYGPDHRPDPAAAASRGANDRTAMPSPS